MIDVHLNHLLSGWPYCSRGPCMTCNAQAQSYHISAASWGKKNTLVFEIYLLSSTIPPLGKISMLEIGSLLICLFCLKLFITSTSFWFLFPPQTRYDCCNSSRNPKTNADSQCYSITHTRASTDISSSTHCTAVNDLDRRSSFFGDLSLGCRTWIHGCYQDNAR
jgi:hypothetical protein